MPGLTHLAQVTAGVLIHSDGQIDPILEVLLDRFDGGRLPHQGQVQDVGAAERVKPDAVAGPELHVADANAVEPWPFLPRVPVRHGSPPSGTARRPRIVPCSPSN